jgi:hypothetical protein
VTTTARRPVFGITCLSASHGLPLHRLCDMEAFHRVATRSTSPGSSIGDQPG